MEAKELDQTKANDIFNTHSNPDAALARTLTTIEALGLNQNLMDLQTLGYTTVKGVLDSDKVERTKRAILDRAEKTSGKKIDLETATQEDFDGMTYLHYMLYDDVVFEEVMMEEKPLALITYLLGESCHLSSIGCHFKGMGEAGVVPLHSDAANGAPSPLPSYSLVANVNYALTPYSKEAGALAMVPHSHTRSRQPTETEMMLSGDQANPEAVSMDLEPGDAVVWHGNSWHGSFPRQIPGIRMNLAVFFARHFVVPQELHRNVVPQEVLDRNANNKRFHKLLGGKQAYGWQDEGPNYEMMAEGPKGLYD